MSEITEVVIIAEQKIRDLTRSLDSAKRQILELELERDKLALKLYRLGYSEK